MVFCGAVLLGSGVIPEIPVSKYVWFFFTFFNKLICLTLSKRLFNEILLLKLRLIYLCVFDQWRNNVSGHILSAGVA
jgi:hypothetical protein